VLIDPGGEDKGQGSVLKKCTDVNNNKIRDKVATKDLQDSSKITEVLRTGTYTSFSPGVKSGMIEGLSK
jgi:hypothetical protein